jgi:enterochelin esterase-like enzyme
VLDPAGIETSSFRAATAWLEDPTAPGRTKRVAVRVLGRMLRLRVWSPGEGELPLLLVHDGPEYAARAALLHWAGATIESRAVAPFRVALLPPGDRNEWYSASAAYGRALCRRILPALAERVAVSGRPVGMGASLGALAMLQAQRAWPGTFAGLFLQSGSFFVPRFDRQESGFPRYGRIVRFVRGVRRGSGHVEPVPVTMTCGRDEENIHNNRLIAAVLSEQGYDLALEELASGHDYPSWRDALHPHLTARLATLWPAR